MVNAIFSGLASGSFLFLGINEILIKGLKDKKDLVIKYLMFALGFALIVAALAFFGVKHNHGGEEGHGGHGH